MLRALPRPVGWLLSPEAGLVYCGAAGGLLEATFRGPSLASLLLTWVAASQFGVWVVADSRRRGVALPYDFGSFVFFLGWLMLPGYLIASRGWKGLLVVLGIFSLWAAPFLIAFVLRSAW